MSKGQVPTRKNANSALISRLRKLLAVQLGFKGDPFSKEWRPHFRIDDERSAPDDRAKREAERRTDSFEEELHSCEEYPWGESGDDERGPLDDEATRFLRDRGS
jgi:hypothetical protein